MPQSLKKPIGVRVDDLKVDVKSGLRLAARMGFKAAEIGADSREVCPGELSESGRKHLARLVRSGSMAFAALSQDAKLADLTNVGQLDRAVESTMAGIRLASDMQVPILSKGLGPLSSLCDADREMVLGAIRDVSQYAERLGTTLAIRSRSGGRDSLVEWVRKIDCPGLKIGLDPGEMVAAGIDPLAIATAAGDRLAIAYVRDAQVGTPDHAGSEVPLGQGALDLPAYLAHLSLHAHLSAPILRRSHAANVPDELAADKQTLQDAMLF